MKYLLVLIISIIVNQNLIAQKVIDIFRMEIPENVLNNKNYYDQISVAFDYYAHSEPSLIAYYLEYLNKKYFNSINNADSNGYNLLQTRTRQLINKRNNWLQKELKDAWEEIPTVTFAFKVRSYLDYIEYDEGQFKEVGNQEDIIDRNYINYCMLKYYSADSSMKYNKEMNYSKLIPEVIKPINENILNKINNVSNLSRSERYEIADNIHSYFLLFNEGYGNDLYPKMNMRAYEYLTGMFEKEFKQSSSIGIIHGQTEFIQTTNYSFDFFEQLSARESIGFRGDFENKFVYSKYIGVLLKLQLRDFIRPYSYISIGLSKFIDNEVASATSTVPEKSNQYYVIRPDTGNFGYRVDSYYEFTKLTEPSITTFSAQVNIPVYYAFRKLYLEIGFNYSYFNSKFRYSLSRRDEFYSPNNLDPSHLVNYTHIYEFETTRHSLYPTITVTYDIMDYVSIKSRFLPIVERFNFEVFVHI